MPARSRLDALICAQEGLSSLTRETLEAAQLQKLNRLLMRERQRAGFYGHLPSSLSSLSELSALPFTTEEDLARYAPGLMLTSQSAVSRVLSDATSGTTGLPKRVFYTAQDLENTVSLYMAGLGELIFPGDRVCICFPFSGPNGLGELIAEAVSRLGAAPLKLGGALSYGEFSAVLDAEKPSCFVGMPVQLLGLLRACGPKSLRRALVSGDACPQSVTRASEAILGARLFPHYGSREMGMAGAITCPAHQGMHLRENHIIAEIVDENGRVLPAGERGELVVTTVGMEALPLIRYRTGDVTRIFPEPCPCGSVTARLDAVSRTGPAADMLQLDEALFSFPQVVDCRAEEDGEKLILFLLTAGEPDADRITRAAAALFPQKEISLTFRPVLPSDRALYPGKRCILRKTE